MSRSRAKGTAWESAIVDFLRGHGWPHAERRALNGARDRGDIAGLPGLVIEAKDANRIELAEWVKEVCAEARNAEPDPAVMPPIGIVWAHRKGKASPGDGYVIMDGRTLVRLLKEAGW